jgi:hypothetical protein
MAGMKTNLNIAVGDSHLCAWQAERQFQEMVSGE